MSKRTNCSADEADIITQEYLLGFSLDRLSELHFMSAPIIRKILIENNITLRKNNFRKKSKAKPKENTGNRNNNTETVTEPAKATSEKRDIRKLEEGEPINCDTEGKRCIYRAPVTSAGLCDYISKIGKMRGCDPDKCTKWKVKGTQTK